MHASYMLSYASLGDRSVTAYRAGVPSKWHMLLSDVLLNVRVTMRLVGADRTPVLVRLGHIQVLCCNVSVQVTAVGLPLSADVALVSLDVKVHCGHVVAEAVDQEHLPAVRTSCPWSGIFLHGGKIQTRLWSAREIGKGQLRAADHSA